MKVSIITISYNQAEFLEQTIQSVIKQDYPDVEYIVVDPGSTDGSRQIIEKYRSRISRVIFDPDKGPADGLNKGFALATGDIYGYINSDDYYLPGSIKKIVNIFEDNPQFDVVSGNAYVVDRTNRLLRYSYSDIFSLKACAYGFSILIQPSSFFRSDIFKKAGGFNINNHSNWDDELFIEMKMRNAKFKRIDDYLSAYRVYDASITGSGKFEAKLKEYNQCRFEKILGRRRIWFDVLPAVSYRMLRYMTNPRDLYQRMRFGPIYRRYS